MCPSAPFLLQEPQSERRSSTKLRPGKLFKTLAAATRAILTADTRPRAVSERNPMTTASAKKSPRKDMRFART
jgi:hypothetical protein